MSAKILVVDDEISLKRLIEQRFRHRIRNKEFDFVFAHNGREALEKLQADSSVDIVLVDFNMPKMDGLTFLERLKEIDPTIKAVVISAYDDIKNIRAAMNRGAFDFITKPIDFQDLEITIDKTLEYVRDIKEKQYKLQQTQDQLLQANEALREREALLHTVITNAPIVLYALDREGVFTLSEGKGLEAVELKPGQVVGQSIFELHQYQSHIRKHVHGVFAGKEAMWLGEIGDVVYENRATPLRDEKGQIIGLIGVATDVTEQLKAETALRESEQRLQSILEHSPVAVYIKDPQGRYLLINQQVERNAGRSKEQMIGKTDSDFLPQVMADALRANDREVLNTLTPIAREEVLLMEDGVHTYLSVKFPLFDTKGVPYGVCGISTEITERKAAEQALCQLNEQLDNRVRERTAELERTCEQLKVEMTQRASAEVRLRQREQEFRALVENAPDIIARFDRELRHLYINPTIELISGRLQSEFIGKTNRELGMPDANAIHWEQALRKIFETGREERIEFNFWSPNGLKHYQSRLVPELGVDGEIVSVLGISRDVTDYKQALSALRESEERFRQLAENIKEVFWITTPEHDRIIYVSPAYESLWSRSCEQLYEQPRSWLDAIHPDDRDCISALLDTLQGREYDREYRIVRPDGSILWIRDRCFPVKDETGQVYRLVGIAEDITVRKLAEEEISKALQREKELSELKSSFVAMTSHEFRTPLTTIQSSVELLERYRNKWSEEKQLTHLRRISTSTARMTQMLNDILIISEAEAGKLKFQPSPLDLVKFCRDLVEDLQQNDKNQHAIGLTASSANALTPKSRLPTSNSLPLMDEKLLRQILTNLLSNALKYSPAGSTVQFDLVCFDNEVVFRIQDQGIGIPYEDQLRLFDSFHRATNVGTIQGTGLGLAIVKQCVDLHQGKITVDSIEGIGTTFTVTLPLL